MKEESEGKELEFVRYMEFVTPLDEFYEALRCVRLQSATAGSDEKGHDVGEKEKRRVAVAAGEWFEVISCQSIASTMHVVWVSIAVHLCTTELPSSSHQSYIRMFFWESVVKRSSVHEQRGVYLVLVFCKEIACSS